MATTISNNLYPKFVLNEAGAYTTDTMHRVFIKEGVNKKAFSTKTMRLATIAMVT